MNGIDYYREERFLRNIRFNFFFDNFVFGIFLVYLGIWKVGIF